MASTGMVILAGGVGSRMRTEINNHPTAVNKVYLQIGGKHILWYPLVTMLRSTEVRQLIVVARPEDRPQLESVVAAAKSAVANSLAAETEAAAPAANPAPIAIVDGGASRHASERAGIEALRPAIESGELTVVAVHDGARPFVHHQTVRRVLAEASATGAAVPGLPVSDTVYSHQHHKVIDSSELVWVQTPQAFDARQVLAAHDAAHHDGFEGVDTAEVVSRYSAQPVRVVPGDDTNVKITFRHDLAAAEPLASRWYAEQLPGLDRPHT